MKIGILYSFVDEIEKEREIEKIADNEICITARAVKEVLDKLGHQTRMLRVEDGIDQVKEFELIFNLAEGMNGDSSEEGKIARYMEKEGIPFTGANSLGLETALNKVLTKDILTSNSILTPKYMVFENAKTKINQNLLFPMIVKPLHEDASIGIGTDSVVKNLKELKKKVNEILRVYRQPALVEEYIEGREINVSLLGNGKTLRALPFTEILFDFPEDVPKIITYEVKWIEESELCAKTISVCPSDIELSLALKIESICKKAFAAVGCKDYGRVDLRLKGNTPYVLEVNPNPCINPTDAWYVRSAKLAGYSYEDLIFTIVSNALMRHKVNKEIKAKILV